MQSKVIAFDIDGTLTNDIQIMKDCIHRWNLHVGYTSSQAVSYDPTKVSLIKFPPYMNTEEFWEYTKMIHQYPEIDAYTREAIRGIRKMGYSIVLITKRPNYKRHATDNTYTDTAQWLRNNGIDFDQLICTNDEDKGPILKEYNCEYIVENNPSIFKDLQEHYCDTVPILLRKPYNRSYEIYTNQTFLNSVYDFYIMLARNQQNSIGG